MNIGYACLTVGVKDIKFRTCRKANATYNNLIEIIKNNLESFDKMLDYNIKNNIKLLRINSDIIPFGSHEINQVQWWKEFEKELYLLGKKAKDNNIRLSMHPGQYTVINSKNPDVVKKSINDLLYHCNFMDALGLDSSNKIVLHIGGAYGNKIDSLKRFADHYNILNQNIKNRLVIENDDKIFNIDDAINLGIKLKIPVIYDNLHNHVNPCQDKTDKYWINEAGKTWYKKDGKQKIHYSQQNNNKKSGSHSETINVKEFVEFVNRIENYDIDIMLEVKDKNLSAIKCINTINNSSIVMLEKEWAKYKYLILEHSPKTYNDIRMLLKDKNAYPVLEFYSLIDKALSYGVEPGCSVNAVQHVWGYFKKQANCKLKESIEKEIRKIENGSSSISAKRILWKMAKESREEYLLQSLYFKDVL